MKNEYKIFLSFFRRDLHVYRAHALQFLVNGSLIIPMLFSLSFGIVLPYIGTGAISPVLSTTMVLGSSLWIFYQVPGKMCIELFYDMIEPQFIVYQISVLMPWIVLLEKTLFTSFITFLHMIPFFFVSKILMGSLFLLKSTIWSQLIVMVYLGGLFISNIMLFMVCFVKDRLNLRNFMVRFILPLIQLAGFFGVSWHTLYVFSPTFAKIALLNPYLYIGEGLRYAVLQDPIFIPFSLCAPALIMYSTFFFYLSCVYFKKKMDHI